MENKFKNKIIKMGKNKIEVKPYISTTDLSVIEDVCVKQINSSDNKNFKFYSIHLLFDLLVISLCTDLRIKGITIKTLEGNTSVNVDINEELISSFEESQLQEKILPLIKNYDRCYSDIIKMVELVLITKSIYAISDKFPNVDNITTSLSDSVKELVALKNQNPQIFDALIKENVDEPLYKESKKEVLKGKKQKKS